MGFRVNGSLVFLLAKEPRGNPVCKVDAIVVDDRVDVPDVEGSYEGEYVNQDGKLVLSGGGKCVSVKNPPYGEISYGEKSKSSVSGGQGKFTFAGNNDCQERESSNNVFSGQGRRVFPNGNSYEGNFKNDNFEGWGKFTFAGDNNYYEGDFKNGKFEGWGRRVFSSGDSYEGNFKNGKSEGWGKFTFAGNNNYYEGNFKNGNFEGWGRRVFPNGNSYKGNFKNDNFEGWGKFTFAGDNNYYEGDFKNGKVEGWGRRVFSSGDSYEGHFKNGNFEGWGVYVYADGEQQLGTWKSGNREGMFECLGKDGESFELLYREGRLESKRCMSIGLYGENGKIAEPGAEGKRRVLYITKFASDSGEATSSSYTDYHIYEAEGGLKRTIRVDYNILNAQANRGITSFDELVAGGAIRDVTEGPEGSGNIRTFGVAVECLRRAVRQYMENVERIDEGILEVGMNGEMINLLQLTNLGTPEQFNSMRFANPGWNEARLESIYSNLETFLGALGINATSLKGIKTDFITLSLSTTNRKHRVSLIINVRTIEELLIQQAGQLSSINANAIFCFDSSRAMDCQEDGLDLGGITKYCRFVNQNLQKHGVCWLYAATATLVAARDPDLVGRLLTGGIQSYGSGEERERPGLPNEFERKVLQLLSAVTFGAGVVVGKQLVSRLVVRDGLIGWLKKFSKDQTLINVLNSRINAVLESTEEERGIKFSPNFAMGVIKCYADQLSKKIQDTNSRVTRAQPELGLEKDDEDAEHILILDKIEAFQELEIRMVDYLGETKFVARRNWWQNLTSRFLLMFFLPMFGAPPAGQIIYWDPENRPSGKYAPWTEGNPGRPAARLGQDNGGVEAPVATEAATQVLDRKPWKWIKYLLPWF